MISNPDLFDVITEAAIRGADCDIAAHKRVIWQACVALMADMLLNSDEFTRVRLLHELPERLQRSMEQLAEVERELRPAAPISFPTVH